MPPQSSLPLRDGRVGPPIPSSPSSSHSDHDDDDNEQPKPPPQNQSQPPQHPQHNPNEPYYSDEDIALLYDIVTLGETILPTLPEQNRLPTEALFSAAEQILPDHGYHPDHPPPHLSRLIFKIGGQRAGETLGDKFRSVLEGMGIKLDYIPTSPGASSAAAQSSPVAVARRAAGPRVSLGSEGSGSGSGSGSEEGEDVSLPRYRRVSGVSRRHSSSLPRPAGGQQVDLPIRPASGVGVDAGGQARARSLSLTDYDSDAALEDALLSGRKETRGGEGENRGASQGDNERREQIVEEHERPVNPVLRAAHALTRVTSEDYHPHEEGEDEPDDTTPELPILSFQAHIPVMERASKRPRRFGLAQDDAELSEPEVRDVSTVGDTDIVHHSPRTEGSDLFRGASDTTAQTPDEQYSPPLHIEAADLELLEGKLHQFKVRDGEKLVKHTLITWRFNAIITKRDHHILEQQATDYDDLDMAAEVLDIWNEEAIIALEEKIAAQVAAEHEAYVAKMERRAQRVYEILTIQNVLSHWQDHAQDEVERTAVARRHLVRKRAFDSWRTQHIEDETKVKNFVLINAMQKWTQVALHHEVRHQVSGQRYEKTMAELVIRTMWEDHKGRVADNFRWFKLAEECLHDWSNRAQEVQTEMEVAETGDNALILYEVVDIWREEAEDFQYRAYEGSMQLLTRECIRDLEYWHEQARLKRLLAQYTTTQTTNLTHHVLDTWHSASLLTKRHTLLSNALLLKDPLTHWTRQTKLQLFLARNAKQTKANLLYTWYLEERLAWYQRHLEHELLLSTLHTLLSTTRHVRSARVRSTQDADYIYTDNSVLDILDTWRYASESTWKPRHNANLILLYRTTMPVLEVWRKNHRLTVARVSHNRLAADRQAKRWVAGHVLGQWPRVAGRVKRERLMNTLREFRRNYKLELAEGCLETWWLGTRDSLEMGRDKADGMLVDNKRGDILGMLECWGERAERNRYVEGIAADAEVEVWCKIWGGRMEEMEGLRGLAVRWDADEVVRGCWGRLEFQSLQRLAVGRTVAAVREKNDRRFCGRVLEEWLDKAVPVAEGADETMGMGGDPRFGILGRRSLRQRETAARSTSAVVLGRGGGGYYNDNRNVFTPAGSLIGSGGGGGLQRGGGRATTTAHRVYTGGGYSNFETPQPPPPLLPSVSQLGGPPATSNTRPHQSQTQRTFNTTNPNRSLHFGSSIATPAQPQPRPLTDFDLDEEEDSLLLSLGGPGGPGEVDPADDSDGPPPDLGFMSTPSRRLSRTTVGRGGVPRQSHQQQPPSGIPRHMAAATTTPSAILATPSERELRRIYGQGSGPGPGPSILSRGQGLGQALGLGLGSSLGGRGGRDSTQSQRGEQQGGGGRPARVVEFADIREESAEF